MTRLLAALLRAVRDLDELGQRGCLATDDRRRPQDLDDLLALLREASPEDLEQARTALQLIRERSFHRDKHDLVEQLDQLLSDHS